LNTALHDDIGAPFRARRQRIAIHVCVSAHRGNRADDDLPDPAEARISVSAKPSSSTGSRLSSTSGRKGSTATVRAPATAGTVSVPLSHSSVAHAAQDQQSCQHTDRCTPRGRAARMFDPLRLRVDGVHRAIEQIAALGDSGDEIAAIVAARADQLLP
jgi:hypothetical protein